MQRNIWHSLDDNGTLWVGQYIVPNFASNAVAVKVTENHWLLSSPGEPMLTDWQARWPDFKGKLSIIMPNAYHYLGVSAWQDAYPQARIYASAKAAGRLRRKGLKDIGILEKQQPALPEGARFLFPPGHRGGDVWLSLRRDEGAAWITCDSFLNYERLSNQPVARTLQKLLGTAPGLRIGEVIRWFILDDRKAFKAWVLKQLATDKPSLLIPGHGEVADDPGLAEKLAMLINQRL